MSFDTAKLNHYRHLHHYSFHDALEKKFSRENPLEWINQSPLHLRLYEADSSQSCCLHLSSVSWMRDFYTVPRACQTAGALSHAHFPFPTWSPLSRPYHKPKDPGPWRLHQYWAHTHQGLAAIGGTWIRLDDHRMPRQLLYGELGAGKRKKNRPRERYKDTVKVNFRWCDI